jgi:quercetin dioxygenase-like cupin family protein
MTARLTPAAVSATAADVEAAMNAEGLRARAWTDAPGTRYGWHGHEYPKVLYCVVGSIVFHTRDGDVDLEPGDRLDLDAGTEHAATVGPGGVTCVEAYVIT